MNSPWTFDGSLASDGSAEWDVHPVRKSPTVPRRPLRPTALSLTGAAVLGAATFAFSGSSNAAVSAVEGSAYGYQLVVGLFGGSPTTLGFGQTIPPGTTETDSPSVELAAAGSSSPVTATEPSVLAAVGPATFLQTGTQTVSSEGTTGPAGSVTSGATIADITTDAGGVLTTTELAASCTSSASTGALSGATSIAAGRLQTDSGQDTGDEGDHAPVVIDLPANPGVNFDVQGHIHVGSVQEDFVVRFNEQVTEDGALTVIAAHQFIGVISLDPTVPDADSIAKGDLRIGKVTCGLAGSPDGAPTTTTLAGETTTTTAAESTTTTAGVTTTTAGATTTTTAATTSSSLGATSTTEAGSTTTTRAGATGGTAGGTLPRTGSAALTLGLLGLALLAGGAVLRRLGTPSGPRSGA